MEMDEAAARFLKPVTERTIGCAFRVANALGHGFAEKIDENALAHEQRMRRLGAVQHRKIAIFYDGVIIDEFTADLPAGDQVIVELKVASALSDMHIPRCWNYPRATGKPQCLPINSGRRKVEIRRVTAQARSRVPSLHPP